MSLTCISSEKDKRGFYVGIYLHCHTVCRLIIKKSLSVNCMCEVPLPWGGGIEQGSRDLD